MASWRLKAGAPGAVLGGLACALLAACGGVPAASRQGSVQFYATSATATPEPTHIPLPTATMASAASAAPLATPTAGPTVLNLDFSAERHDVVTLHVGQAVKFSLTQGPTSDWLSGVDDARVLRPMAPDGNGVYQAMTPGTALVTAHVPLGCANRSPAVPCKTPEDGLWFQMRVYVLA